ncbi:MAG: thioredoxin [Candidatus Zixiibacteriota bacterium]
MEIKDKKDFEEKVLKSEKPTLVDFFATWCGPCRRYAPILEKLAEEYKGKVNIVKVDVEKNRELATKYNVRSVPTSIIFKDGDAIDMFIGSLPEEELKRKLDSF